MLAIVSSNEKYIKDLVKKFDSEIASSPEKTKLYKCKYEEHDFLLMSTGIGKVNISSSLRYICDFYKINLILVIGTSGCICNCHNILDASIPKYSMQFDADFSSLGYKSSFIPKVNSCTFKTNNDINSCLKNICSKKGIKYSVMPVSSSDTFVSNYRLARTIFKNYNCSAVDCETGIIGEYCYINKIEYAALKIFSNYANNNAFNDYNLYNDDALGMCQDIVYDFIKRFYY